PAAGASPPPVPYPLLRRAPLHAALAGLAVLERAAVLHAHFGTTAQPTWRAARRLGRPFAVSLHGWDLLVAAQRPGADILDAVRAADLVVTPSRFLADAAVAGGADPAVVRVVPSGLDLSMLPFRERNVPAGPPTVTFAGRFAEKKGVLDVVRALATVHAQTPLHARFVGHGPLESQLRSLVADLALPAEIVDGRPPGTVRAALDATDLAITASRTASDGDAESLGLVNLEAQACGVPLVTVAHGGVPEAVCPAAAILVPEDGDVVASLADAVASLLATPADWPAMGRAGRAHVAARYELGSRAADLEQLWLALASGARGGDLPDVREPRSARPTTSVVLVTHDRRRLLERTLDALASQTLPPDEVLVVDNGSTDGTGAVLESRRSRHDPPGLRVITRDANLPVAQGRNLAVAASRGEVVAFTDDDCRPRPTWLEALVAGMRDGVGLVQGRTTADPAQPLSVLSRTQWTPAEFGLYETCNVAYARDALDAARAPAPDGPFDLRFADDVAAVLGPRWQHLPFGEDTELGWRVKRAGTRSRFAVHAVVEHEVFAPDPGLLVRRASLAAAFPALVRRVPELRDTFLWHRYLLGRRRAALWLAAGGAAAAVLGRDGRPALLALPYLAGITGLAEMGRPGGRGRRLAAAPVLLRRDLVESVALLRGSVRARTIVL
ncbi:MAG: glycosyltransferase, partial [Mycobacteriales bacterium]